MRVIAIVNAKTGALCVQEMVDQGDEVVAVVCLPEDPWLGIEPSWSVKEVATRNYLPCYQPPPNEVNKPEFVSQMRKLEADMIVAMHYGVIFRKPLLDCAPRGAVNIHPTRLPRGQGMTPSCWHMFMGDDKNWITLHWIDEGIDTGAIIAQGYVDILPTDTGHDSTNKLLDKGYQLFKENLPLLREGKAPAIPQDDIKEVEKLYYRWKPENARIPWSKSAEEVELHIRALCHPKEVPTYSGEAYTYIGGKKVKIWAAGVVRDTILSEGKREPGDILSIYGEGILVKCGEGAVILKDIDVEDSDVSGFPPLLEIINHQIPATMR
jgi:methionyl-tRNA formyltransferase